MPGLAPGITAVQVFVPAGSTSGDAVPVPFRAGSTASAHTVTIAVE